MDWIIYKYTINKKKTLKNSSFFYGCRDICIIDSNNSLPFLFFHAWRCESTPTIFFSLSLLFLLLQRCVSYFSFLSPLSPVEREREIFCFSFLHFLFSFLPLYIDSVCFHFNHMVLHMGVIPFLRGLCCFLFDVIVFMIDLHACYLWLRLFSCYCSSFFFPSILMLFWKLLRFIGLCLFWEFGLRFSLLVVVSTTL